MLWDCIFRLLLAGVLGGVIGWDREYRAKEAGLRTHFLVALGSALIMIVSQYGFADVLAKPGYGLDPSRVAAQVVSQMLLYPPRHRKRLYPEQFCYHTILPAFS